MDELTPERIKEIETRWKSDVDSKLDRLLRFADEYEEFLKVLIDREKSRQKMRDAIIEKTLSALIMSAVAGLALLAWNGLLGDLKNVITAAKGGTGK